MVRQTQMLVGSLMGSLVILAIVLVFVLPADHRFDAPPPWLLATQFLAGGIVHLVVESVGYRTPAIDAETDEATAAMESFAAYNSATILRFALAEVVALASFASAFVIEDGSVFFYVTGGIISLGLIGFHAWPWARPVDRTIASLERAGGRSHLRERLGLPPTVGGAIQEL